MTKERYYEMCEMLNKEPTDEDLPVEFEDLPAEVQEGMHVYNMLQDNWDTMNGVYLGKQRVGISEIFSILEVDDFKTTYHIVSIIDRIRGELINSKRQKPAK